jgi:hypothetical protein
LTLLVVGVVAAVNQFIEVIEVDIGNFHVGRTRKLIGLLNKISHLVDLNR